MLVLLILAEHANAEGGLSYPSVKRIAKMARMSERGVQYVLRRLIDRALIRIQFEATNKRPTVYCFPAFRGEEIAPQEEDRGATDDSLGVQFGTSRGATVAPKPYVEPSVGTVSKTTSSPAPSREPYTAAFESFWKAYPKTNGTKLEAFKAWKVVPTADRDPALAGLAKWISSNHWREGKIVFAERYLKRRMWRDEPLGDAQNGHVRDIDPVALEKLQREARALGAREEDAIETPR